MFWRVAVFLREPLLIGKCHQLALGGLARA